MLLYAPTTSTFFLKNSNTSGFADTVFVFGSANQSPASVPLAGHWIAFTQTVTTAVQVAAAQNAPTMTQNNPGPPVTEAMVSSPDSQQLPAVAPTVLDQIDLSTVAEQEFGLFPG